MTAEIETASRATAPEFNPAPRVHVVRSDAEAIKLASELATEFVTEAAIRDREQRLPVAELDRFSASGLWVSVPKT
ncbi:MULTISPECIES: hypothetical protein [Bradyrhizobium]|uniref:hypothetical protein n=1 Tax=Bradyrhizobium elkanii TaxID=29448 RepID=UPI00041DAD24